MRCGNIMAADSYGCAGRHPRPRNAYTAPFSTVACIRVATVRPCGRPLFLAVRARARLTLLRRLMANLSCERMPPWRTRGPVQARDSHPAPFPREKCCSANERCAPGGSFCPQLVVKRGVFFFLLRKYCHVGSERKPVCRPVSCNTACVTLSPHTKVQIVDGAMAFIFSFKTAAEECFSSNAVLLINEADFKGAGCVVYM